MITIGEEIENFKREYEKGDKIHRFIAGNLAAGEFFKAKQIWEYIRSQPKITREDAFGMEEGDDFWDMEEKE